MFLNSKRQYRIKLSFCTYIYKIRKDSLNIKYLKKNGDKKLSDIIYIYIYTSMVKRGKLGKRFSLYLQKHGHPFKLSTLVIAVCAQVNPTTRRSRYVGKLDSPLTKLKVTAAAVAGCTCIALISR